VVVCAGGEAPRPAPCTGAGSRRPTSLWVPPAAAMPWAALREASRASVAARVSRTAAGATRVPHPLPVQPLRVPRLFYTLGLGLTPVLAALGSPCRAEGICRLLTRRGCVCCLHRPRDAAGSLLPQRFPESGELTFSVKYAATSRFSHF